MALILLAVVGVALVVAGVSMFSIPAGLIVAGFSAVAAAYLIAEERDS